MSENAGTHPEGKVILVGVDGSPGSLQALTWALGEAERNGATVRAAAVVLGDGDWRGSGIAYSPKTLAELHTLVGDQLANVVAGAVDERPIATETVVLEGFAASALLEAAVAADLLVLSASRHGALGSIVLGSVADQCVRHAPIPVAVVPASAAVAEPIRQVVAGIDDSAGALRALTWAVAETVGSGAELVVINTWDESTAAPPSGMADSEEHAAASQELVRRMVHQAVDAIGGPPPAVHEVVLQRPAADALLHAVEPDDILVVGSRGRGGFRSLVLGSTSYKLMHHAPCVVVVVPGHP